MAQQVQKIGVLFSAILLAMIALTVFSGTLLTNVTDPVTQVFESQVTQNTAGSPDLSLTLTEGVHWFTDTTEMSITGATTGSLFTDSTITLDAARTGLSIDIPAGATVTEDVTVNYVTEDDSQGTTGWKLVPLFVILVAVFGIGGAIFVGIKVGRSGEVAVLLIAIAVLFVGVILGEVVKVFTGDAIDLYALQPDYTGVGSLLPLVDLGYVFALFGIAGGSVAGFGSKLIR